jgi:hypothetical protein
LKNARRSSRTQSGNGPSAGSVPSPRRRSIPRNSSPTGGFLWHGDYNDTDLPYVLETESGKLVAIAHSDFTDNRTLRSSPRDFYNVYKDTFDYLYNYEAPSLINLTVHAHFGGRPLMSAMLHDLLRYMKEFPDVWFARHDEVARWTLDNAD